MTSNILIDFPGPGPVPKATMRAQFLAANTEIVALQAGTDIAAGAIQADKIFAGTQTAPAPVSGVSTVTVNNTVDIVLATDPLITVVKLNTPAARRNVEIFNNTGNTIAIQDAAGGSLRTGIEPLEVSRWAWSGSAWLHKVDITAADHIHTISDTTGLQAALDAKQSTLVAGQLLTGLQLPLADTQITASRNAALTDANQTMLRVNSASAVTYTVVTDATVNFPIGTVLQLVRWGTGTLTIAASGVTINKPTDRVLTARAQYSVVSLWKQAANVWLCFGDLA
jgi:hypothetical protein